MIHFENNFIKSQLINNQLELIYILNLSILYS